MIVFFSLQGLYVSVLEKQWDLEPFVVARKGTVLDCNLGAATREVAPGMSLKEAKAILRGAPVLEWEPDPYRSIQRQWLDICAEASETIEPVDQHQAFIDLSAHPRPIEIAQTIQGRVEKRLGLQAAWGASPVKWIARRLAFEPGSLDATTYALQLQIGCLPISKATGSRLEFLGCNTGADIYKLSRKQLRDQFGDEADLILSAAQGKGPLESVKSLYPPKSVLGYRAFDGSIEDALEVDRALFELAERLHKELTAIDRQGRVLLLSVELEGGITKALTRRFSRAIQSQQSLISAMRREWEALEIANPVSRIQVEMKHLERPREVQQPLTAARSIESERKLEVMSQGVRQLYGEAILRQGHEVHEPRRNSLLRIWKDVTGWA